MTKADFWDKIQSEYPEEMGEFLSWLEEYKRRENWSDIFGETGQHNVFPSVGIKWTDRIDFFNLPNAMQIGIFIQYTVEQGGEDFFQPGWFYNSMADMIQAIRQWFHDEHKANQLHQKNF